MEPAESEKRASTDKLRCLFTNLGIDSLCDPA